MIVYSSSAISVSNFSNFIASSASFSSMIFYASSALVSILNVSVLVGKLASSRVPPYYFYISKI
jgi:hypothetical protein